MTQPARTATARHRWALAFVVMAGTVGCDRITKELATGALRAGERRSWLGDTLRVEYTENRGAFLGLGSGLAEPARFWVLTVGTAALLVIATLPLARSRDRGELVAWALLLGGGFSNLMDRVLRDGRVVDFMNLGLGPLRTGIFNLADVAITAGVVFLLLGRTRRLKA